jgi:hypothetical protein
VSQAESDQRRRKRQAVDCPDPAKLVRDFRLDDMEDSDQGGKTATTASATLAVTRRHSIEVTVNSLSFWVMVE